MKIAGIVLAGGQSKRMGSDKSQLKIGEQTLLQHAKQILSTTGIKNIFVSHAEGIKDTYSKKGPVAGIYACLENLPEFDYVIFIPVDMPLLNKFVLLKLISEKDNHAVYFIDQQFPLLIKNNLINRRIIQQQLDNDKLSVRNVLSKLDAKSIESHFPINIFTNTNTEKDWLLAIETLNQQETH